MTDTQQQVTFWGGRQQKVGALQAARHNFKAIAPSGHTAADYLALASAYYSTRSSFTPFSLRLKEAKRLAMKARDKAHGLDRGLSAAQCDTLSTILAAWPASAVEQNNAEFLVELGLTLEARPVEPHTEALLRLTYAELLLRQKTKSLAEWLDRTDHIDGLIEEVKDLLPEIDTEGETVEEKLHAKRQKTRVLRRLGVLLVKVGQGVDGYEYINDAFELAEKVSEDQLQKIRWAMALLHFNLGWLVH